MRFLSVCSGIEAASAAWSPLGWRAVAFSEIEPFPCAVLAHHYPDTPNWGDMTQYKEWPDVSIDLLCGGTPCQSFSVAGLRKGLDDPRGNLMLTYGAIAAKYRPKWLVWENVPGVLSSNGGVDFGTFLGMLGQLGYGFAYRVLDAQYFGVAQRRRRVFVVGCLGDWRSAAAVLFERHSLQGHSAPSREARKVAPTIPSRSTAGGGPGTDFDCDGGLQVAGTMKARKDSGGWSNSADHAAAGYMVPVGTICVATGPAGAEIGADMEPTLNCNHEAPYVARTLLGKSNCSHAEDKETYVCFDTTQITSAANRSNPKAGDPCHPLASGAHAPAIAFPANLSGTQCASAADVAPSMGAANPTAVAFNFHKSGNEASSLGVSVERVDCLRAFEKSPMAVQPAAGMQVRRLTPVECERLQGFPTVSEKITIQACLDHQNQSVRVALKCLRWQNSALSAEESALTQPAKTAAVPSSTSPAHLAPLAALHVRMHSVDELLEIRSAGRLIWSASGAGQSERSLPPTLTENSVQELARLLREAARTITAGKAASPPSISLSFPASSGATSAEKFGRETEVSASGAMNDQSRGMFTTSDLGLITMYSGSTVETLCCSALRAIAGCIPNKTLPETFSIELTVETPYTAIPWRGKPADQCPDGPRYKALGNSWAVPNARWIGERISAVELLTPFGLT